MLICVSSEIHEFLPNNILCSSICWSMAAGKNEKYIETTVVSSPFLLPKILVCRVDILLLSGIKCKKGNYSGHL